MAPVNSWVAGTPGKYYRSPAPSISMEGGNVTEANITQAASTEKWAGFWGNIEGSLHLAPSSGAIFYEWDPVNVDGSTLCATRDVGIDWSLVSTWGKSNIDTLWHFNSADADSATNTFNTTGSVRIGGRTITSDAVVLNPTDPFVEVIVGYIDHGLLFDTYYTALCVTAKDDAVLFNGQTGDYELMVPTRERPGIVETYYLWLELH